VRGTAIGLVVDRVSDILTIPAGHLQPMPDMSVGSARKYSDGIIVKPNGMICFLNLQGMFEDVGPEQLSAA